MKAPSSLPAHDLASTGTLEPVDGFAYFMAPDASDVFFFKGNGISFGLEGSIGTVEDSVGLASGFTLHDGSQFVPGAQGSGDLFDLVPAASMPPDPAAPLGANPGIVTAANSIPDDVSHGGALSGEGTPTFESLFPGHSAADLFSTLADPITGDSPDQTAVGPPAADPAAGDLTGQSTWSSATLAELKSDSSTSFFNAPDTLSDQPNSASDYLGFAGPLHVGSAQSLTLSSGFSPLGQPSNSSTIGAEPGLFGPALSNNVSGPALPAAGDRGFSAQQSERGGFLAASGGPVAQAASAASVSLGTAAASGSSQIVTLAGSGLVFDNTFDSGVSATFQNEIVAAENYLQSLCSNTCTVNVTFDLESINPNYSGENFFNPIVVSYSSYINALEAHAATATEEAAVAALANLPDPSHGSGFEISIGEARILGLAGPGSSTDDTVILNSVYWTASALQNHPGDAEAVIEHELTEGIFGRIGSLGIADPPYWSPMDLFRFTASGQRDFTGGQDGKLTYFSVNGSNVYTGLQYHNPVNGSGQFDGFDFADWDQVGADANAHDPFGPGGPGVGDPGTLSATDIAILEALGWNPSTTYVWGTGTNGSFATAANWSPGILPTSGIDVVLIGTGNYTVTSSVSETVNSLSTAAGTTFNITGGTFTVDNGTGTGTNAGTIEVESGATLVVHGTMSGTIKILGGTELDYGTSAGTIVNSGGAEYVEAGGTANTTTVNSGGYEYVEAGGTANTTTVNSGYELDYGTSAGTTVNSGGYEYVQAGGTANTTTVNSGGYEFDYGTSAGTTVSSGGVEYAQAGGTANTTTVNSGGYEIVQAGGTANTTTVNSGGYEFDYGTSAGTTVNSGGYEYVLAGGTANTTTVNNSGYEVDYGTSAGTTVNSGGYEYVEAGGTANTTTVNSGGYEVDYGTSAETTVSSGGVEYAQAGGTANTTTVNSGGYEIVQSGGTANTTTVNSGGYEFDYGTSAGTTVSSGGYEYVQAGSTANTTTVNSGGYEVDYGTSTGTTVSNGGVEYVQAGGTAITTTVNGGGYELDYGTSAGATVNSGGIEYVQAGGTANSTTVNTGGYELDYGTSAGTTVNSGGYEIVQAGGTANTPTVNSGGYEYVQAGATASGTTLAGGTVVVLSGGAATGTFIFAGSGLLVLNDLNYSGLQLAGFTATTDKIDFTGISFSGSTHFTFNTTTDLLTVTDGTHTATMTIDGQHTQQSFTISSDGIGGTIITDPALSADGVDSFSNTSGFPTITGGAHTATITTDGQHTQQNFTMSFDGSGGTIATDAPLSADTSVGSFSNTSGGTHTASITTDEQHTQQSFTISSDGSGGTIVTDPLLSADGSVGSFSNTSGQPTITDGTHTAAITTDGQNTQQSFTMSSDGSGGTIVTDPLLSADGSVGSFSSGTATPAATPVETPVASSAPPADHGAAATAGLAALGNPQNDTFVFNMHLMHLGSNSMATPQSPFASGTMSQFATFDPTQASHGGSPTGALSFGPAAIAEHVSFDFGTHDANPGATVLLSESHPVDLYAHPPLIG